MKSVARIIGVAAVFACLGWGGVGVRAQGVFSSSLFAGDADSGISTNKTYVALANIRGGANATVNDVVFTAGDSSGSGWILSGAGSFLDNSGGGNLTGNITNLVDDFRYAGNPATFAVTNLTVGETYVLTFYNKAWGDAGTRWQNISTTDGGTTAFDENMGGDKAGNMLRYTFTATNATQTLTFSPRVAGNTMHFYGASAEQTFDNLWTGGTDWSAATWSKVAPSGQGANASFVAQASPTTLNLDADRTVGHLQFAGTNEWTLSSSSDRTLTLSADAGGVSVLGAVEGSHTISNAVSLGSDAVKFGAGTLNISGAISGSKVLNVNMGSLVLSGSNTFSGGSVLNGGGILSVGDDVHLGNSSAPVTFAGGTLQVTGTTLTNFGSHGVNWTNFNGRFDIADAGHTFSVTNALQGSGRLAKAGAGKLLLTGANTIGGGVTISAGTLQVGNGGSGATLGGGPVTNQGSLVFDHSDTQTVGGVISGSGTLTKAGGGMLLLGGANTYGGATIVSGGTLKLQTAAPLVTNGTFEAPVLGANSYTYYSSLGGAQKTEFVWGSANNGGLAGALLNNSTAWGYTMPYPSSNQMFSLQKDSSLTQSIYFASPGSYVISWSQARRATQENPYYFQLNGVNVGATFSAPGSTWSATNTLFAVPTSGTYAIGFLGTSGADNSVGLDSVSLASGAALPTNTAVSLTASGAVLDLSGTAQTIGSLAGVAGSSVLNEGALTAGGDNTSTEFSGVISGAGSLTKAGGGTWTNSGANTYSGLTTIPGGQLVLNHSLAAQNSTVSNTVANGLAFGPAAAAYSVGALAGGGNIALTNTAGAVTFSAGSNNASTLYSGSLSGSGAFAKTGSGTLILTGANAHSGGTLISGGTLQLNGMTAGGALGSGPVTNHATLAFRATNLVTVANTISGTGSLIQSPSASYSTTILALTGVNSYSGGTTISNGGVRAQHASAFGTGPVTVQSNGLIMLWWNTGSSTMSNDFILGSMGGNASGDGYNKNAIHTDGAAGGFSTFTLSGTITLNANSSVGTYQDNNLVISGKITGAGGLSRGIGRPNEGATVTLSNTGNDYAGDTTVRAGTLRLGASGVIPDGGGKGNLIVSAGTFDVAGFNETVNGLSGAGTVNNSAGTGTLTVGNNNATGAANSFTGVIQNTVGTLALVKTGTGILTLSGASSYSGGTTIQDGTVQLGHAGALGGGGKWLTMNGGTLDLRGFDPAIAAGGGAGGTITDNGPALAQPTMLTVTQAANGVLSATLADGASQKVGLLKTGSGVLTLGNTNAHAYSGPTIIAGGTLRLNLPQTAAPSGAVAYYNFDAGVADVTANAHGGVLEGAGSSFVAGRPGSGGTALNLTGGQDVAVNYKADLGLNNYTVSSWVNLNAAPGTFGILGTRFGGENTFDLKVMADKLHGDVGSGTGWLNTTADFSYAMPTGAWHMITYAVDGTANQIRMYLDGSLANTLPIGGTPLFMKAGQTLKLGASYTGEYMNGQMDDLYLYGSALSGGQVLQLYQSGVAGMSANQLPTSTVVSIQSGATLDVAGVAQTLAGLSDYAGGGGFVTNSRASTVALTLNTPAGTNVSFGGVIADGGAGNAIALLKDGPGTQALAGANTFSGGTTISNGVLRIGAGGTSGSIGSMANYGTVVFDRTDTNTHAGVISGSGAVVKEQANTLVLAADSSAFTGGTAVSNGTLSVNGQLGGLITVYSNATLGGVGTVRDVVVAESGILAPGNSAGILTASEAVTLQSNAVLSIELGEFGSDQLAMAGNLLTLEPGAVLNVSFLDGFEGSVTNFSTFAIVSGWNTGVFTIGGVEKNSGDQFMADGKTLQIDYNLGGDNIILTVIPEPATVGLLGVWVIAALLRRRFRA